MGTGRHKRGAGGPGGLARHRGAACADVDELQALERESVRRGVVDLDELVRRACSTGDQLADHQVGERVGVARCATGSLHGFELRDRRTDGQHGDEEREQGGEQDTNGNASLERHDAGHVHTSKERRRAGADSVRPGRLPCGYRPIVERFEPSTPASRVHSCA